MKIIVEQIKTSINTKDETIFEIARARTEETRAFSNISNPSIYKRSIDARHNSDIRFVSSVIFDCEGISQGYDLIKLDKYQIKVLDEFSFDFKKDYIRPDKPPVIVGFGPCGMFCALILARAGFRPIVIERGSDIEKRISDVNNFKTNQILNENSNVQFGAGGAGTFSDGKLTTRINDKKCSFILKSFVEFGAPYDILTKAKPHIGTDKLVNIVKNIDSEIRSLGGNILYDTTFLSNDDKFVYTTKGKHEFSSLILAIGNSSRDTYDYLLKSGYSIEPKPFSVGVRVEHLQSDLNRALYGDFSDDKRLGQAEYNVSYRKNGRGVYSFCMCPGGEVICAASESESVVVNGMSNYKRDKVNANSAIAVQVDREDYGSNPYKAIEFQRSIEKKSFVLGGSNYYAPVQTLGDFYGNKLTREPQRIIPSYMNGKYKLADINSLFPTFVCEYLKMGFYEFGKKIKGFDKKDVPITAPETRTSSPVRILRDNETLSALGKCNIYPCGEGAGYAGGIMSSSIDGLNVALSILKKCERK